MADSRSPHPYLVDLHRSSELSQDDFICNQLFDAILAQRLLPGTKLPEDELARIFNVSRAVVRRALQRMAHDSVIELRLNRGATVASPGVKKAREILDVRRLIENAIVREATRSATEAQLAALRNLVTRERACFEHGEPGTGRRLSGDFHLRLAEMADNSTLTDIISSLIPQASLVIAQYERPGHAVCSHQEHLALIECVAEGDADRAADMMDEHLQHIEDRLALTEAAEPTDLRAVFAHVIKPAETDE